MTFSAPVAHVIIAFLLIMSISLMVRAFKRSYKDQASWYLFIFTTLATTTVLVMVGPWPYLAVPLRYIVGRLVVFGLAKKLLRAKDKAQENLSSTQVDLSMPTSVEPDNMGPLGHLPMWPASTGQKAGLGFKLFRTAFWTFLLYLAFGGMVYKEGPEPIKLGFPFKGQNEYWVMQGGGSRLDNLFHGNFSWRKYGYAVDLARLDKYGRRANGFIPSKLEDYYIFGDTVYSPSTGRVLHLVDGVENNPPGEILRDKNNVHGNHIVIQSKDYRVFMAHYERNSFMVKQGDSVRQGQALGRVGNAGFTVEPHLHIHAYTDYDVTPQTGLSHPMLFGPDQDFLYLNKTFVPGD